MSSWPKDRLDTSDGDDLSASVQIEVDGRAVVFERGVTVAAALAQMGRLDLRRSVSGERRGVLCGMGTCHECRVRIDGIAHRRACLTLAEHGMRVRTDG